MRHLYLLVTVIPLVFSACSAVHHTATASTTDGEHYRWTRKGISTLSATKATDHEPATASILWAARVSTDLPPPALRVMADAQVHTATKPVGPVQHVPGATASVQLSAERGQVEQRMCYRAEPEEVPRSERPVNKLAKSAFIGSMVALAGMAFSPGLLLLSFICFVLGIIALIQVLHRRERGLGYALGAILGFFAAVAVLLVLISTI